MKKISKSIYFSWKTAIYKKLNGGDDMSDLGWFEAILKVMEGSEQSMHYADIAEIIAREGYITKLGANPATSVNSYISKSIKQDGEKSPFIRISRGEYILRSKEKKIQQTLSNENDNGNIVKAFGMFWSRDNVLWRTSPQMLGQQNAKAEPINFANQIGIYLLYDARDVIYVGRSIDRPIGTRLYEHTLDRHSGRWNRFSWFGLLDPAKNEGSADTVKSLSFSTEQLIATFEALLIEALEPPQNRKRGDDFKAIEYIQATDEEVIKQKEDALMLSLIRRGQR